MTHTHKLWYEQPAHVWTQALPIGNGRLGAMVFGRTDTERLALNELTLSAGGPYDDTNPEASEALPEIRRLVFAGEYAQAQALADRKFMGKPIKQMPYQTIGDLLLAFGKTQNHPESVTNYTRELDLTSAVARVNYSQNGVNYTREHFVSAPDQVLVVRISADKPRSVSVSASFDCPQTSIVESDDHTLALRGTAGGCMGIAGVTKFTALATAIAPNGTMKTTQNALEITDADSVLLLVSIATNYKNYADTTNNPDQIAQSCLDNAAQKTYQSLLGAHADDYSALFDRVKLTLGQPQPYEPTDMRLHSFQNQPDPALVALQFHYGRCLLIMSSRPGSPPANLQGLWNDSLDPPWGAKYTVNINTQMNYWLAEACALSECAVPLFQMIAELSDSAKRTAKVHYNAPGWVCHHNTDAWRASAPTDGAFWGLWQTGGAWLCTHLWEHYLFTLDQDHLVQHYPIIKDAGEFFLATLVPEPTHGWLVTCPAISPENAHHPDVSICAGPTMDCQILRDLFHACIEASEILRVDPEFRDRCQRACALLPPMQIGAQGQLQEWMEDWDNLAPEQNHRHISHMYGLHPSHQITKQATPDLFAAARVSLEQRGDAGTGWSLAWKINHWARLQDGDRAYKLVCDALQFVDTTAENYHGGGGVYANLFDAHPPFQIDGNFGFTSGIAEMLLQSLPNELHLLPALPSSWPEGTVEGLIARGNIVVDITWADGKLVTAQLTPRRETSTVVRYNNQTLIVDFTSGHTITLTPAQFS